MNIPHICVGELLKNLAKELYGLASRDEIKNLHIEEILVLHKEVKTQIQKVIELKRLIVLNDHLTPLSQGRKKIKLPNSYITTYSIKAIFVLTSPVNLIIERINKDRIRRTRLILSEAEIINNSDELWLIASQLAKKSNIPIYKIENIEIQDTVRKISQYLQELGVEFYE